MTFAAFHFLMASHPVLVAGNSAHVAGRLGGISAAGVVDVEPLTEDDAVGAGVLGGVSISAAVRDDYRAVVAGTLSRITISVDAEDIHTTTEPPSTTGAGVELIYGGNFLTYSGNHLEY